ncbi:MAG: carbonic anhydrase [Candidatus Angelobacter sp.]
MLEAAAVADRAKLRKRQAIGSLVQRRSRFMVSPGELKGSIRREGIVPSILRGKILDSCRSAGQQNDHSPLRILTNFYRRRKRIRLYNVPTARCLIRKVFHFESPRARYKADAAIVWCFDHRFDVVLHKLTKRIGVEFFDPILVAGGAKCLAGNELERDRQFVLEQVRKSIQLHGTHTVLLMLHSDCGAYGGLAAFDNDTAREAENHRQDLHRAVDFLQAEIPELTIRGFFVDFEGVWEADYSKDSALSA